MPPISSASTMPRGTAMVIVLNPLPLLLGVFEGVGPSIVPPDMTAVVFERGSDVSDALPVEPDGVDMLRSGR